VHIRRRRRSNSRHITHSFSKERESGCVRGLEYSSRLDIAEQSQKRQKRTKQIERKGQRGGKED
jgi:hypothetical protein